MGAGVEKGELGRRVRTTVGLVRWALASRMGIVTHQSQPGGQKKGHQEQERLHLPRSSAQVGAAGVSSFQTQNTGEGRRAGSVHTQTSQTCAPPPSQVSACHVVVHVLCRGLSENDTVTPLVLPPLSHKARRKNKKVKAVVQPAQGLGPRNPSVTESRISSFFDSWFLFDSGEILNNYTIG